MPSQNPSLVKYSILILTYNRIDLIQDRLEECYSVFKNREDVAIEVLSNGCEDGTQLFLMLETPKPKWIKPILTFRHTIKNYGFGPAFNMISKEALGDILFFVSNDVKIWGDFITPVAELLEKVPLVLICHELHNDHTGWNQFAGRMIPYPAGHFLACTKKLWKTIGGFDERFVPHDFEDVDIGMTCQQLEIPMLGRPALPIEHMVAGTIGYSPERMENTVLQRKRFAEKWGLPNIPERP